MMASKRYNIIIIIVIIAILSFLVYRYFLRQEKPIKPIVKPPVSVSVKGRIAIVIDDWGYSLNNAHYLQDIKAPITVAVLPGLPYSRAISKIARKNNKQVILHLPLESKANKNPEKNTIYCSMGKNEIISNLNQALQSVPGILGVNNHQGSKATENTRVMGIILPELKQKNLFFLDSRTIDKSVCAAIAKKSGVRYAKRDIFLDLPSPVLKDEKLRIYIKRQLDKLCKIALQNGYAVGIGHDRKDTLMVLNDNLPLLEKNGIKVISASEVVR
jgi:hypothetical protein